MRQNFLTKALKYTWVLLLALVVFSSSCKDDPIDPIDPDPVVEDGWYVTGAGTALTALDAKGLMTTTTMKQMLILPDLNFLKFI